MHSLYRRCGAFASDERMKLGIALFAATGDNGNGKEKNMSKETKSMLYMLICAALWSIAGIFIKLIPWNAFVITGFRSLIAAAVLYGYTLLAKIPLKFSKRTLYIAISLGLTYFAFVSANKLTTAANAIVLQYCGPVFVLLYQCVVQKKRLRGADVLVVLFTLAGIALFFLDQIDGGKLVGNLIAILSGLFFASMFITTAGVDERTRMTGILEGQLLAACIGLPFMLFTKMEITSTAIISIIVLGVFQLGIPFVFYGLAAKHCPPLALSLLSAVEPLLNPVWVVLFIGEAPSTFALIGGVVVILSVTLWCIYNQKHPSYEITAEE